MKHPCNKCPNQAVWHYTPSDAEKYYCDLCIKRGCDCNIIDPYGFDLEEYKDEQGRLLPCCEYDYDENGFESVA